MSETKKIVITKAAEDTYWYADKVGEVFEVMGGGYPNCKYFVNHDGCNRTYGVMEGDFEEVIEYESEFYRRINRKARVGDLIRYETSDGVGISTVSAEDFENEDFYTEDGAYIWVAMGDKYDVIERLNKVIEPSVPSYAEVSELIHTNFEAVMEPIEQSGQTELDLIANLAQEVAALKKDLHHAQSDIADLEDRVDENEKDTEEVIGRMNDLGDGAEVAAVVQTADFDKLITKLKTYMNNAEEIRKVYDAGDITEKYYDGKSTGLWLAIKTIEEALRNG